MIYAGFDPTFIDINVRPLESKSQNLIQSFPELGSHHTETDIEFRCGGNGFNFCRALSSLGEEVTYVGPSSSFFEQLVKENKINLDIHPIKGAEVNFTAVLNLYGGEVQFNNVRGKLSPNLLTKELINLFNSSPIKTISNVALNETSIEWVSSLILSLSDASHSLIYDSNASISDKLKDLSGASFDGILFIDPSDITHFDRLVEFSDILHYLQYMEGTKYISVNEYEMKSLCEINSQKPQELAASLKIPIICHTAEKVTYYGDKKFSIKTKILKHRETFVGAGDVFNAACVKKLLDDTSMESAITFGIDAASYLIEKGQYPNSIILNE